jgi:23S rRNA pseudouridine2605 synthase
MVNGHIQTDPAWWVELVQDRIMVDGRELVAAEKVYLMLNKPRGLITTTSDERGRATIYDCIDDPNLPWISPVGRLDKASEGLLLLTNDTLWAAQILDPDSHLEKRYHVKVDCLSEEKLLHKLVEGVEDDGECLKAIQAHVLR